MNLKEVKLDKTAYLPDQLILNGQKQIAFAGRSNVGKSSLLNRLFNRKNLAKVSHTPGKTQSINFYLVNEQIYFVDLPGYGYAKASQKERDRWKNLLDHYFDNCKTLVGLAHLLDIRHEPSDLDMMLHEWTAPLIPHHLYILTKADKVSNADVAQTEAAVTREFHVLKDKVVPFSAKTGRGKGEILGWIGSLINQ